MCEDTNKLLDYKTTVTIFSQAVSFFGTSPQQQRLSYAQNDSFADILILTIP